MMRPPLLMAFVVFASVAVRAVHASDCERAAELALTARSASDGAVQLDLLQQAIDLCPTYDIWVERGRALYRAGQYDQSWEAFSRAQSLSQTATQTAEMYGRKGQVSAARGQLCEALSLLEQARDQFGSDAPDWVDDSLRKVESAWSAEVVSAEAAACVARSSRNFKPVPRVNIPIHFEFDGDRLTGTGAQQVAEIAKMLEAFKTEYRFEIVGHTDKQGTLEYNQKLSERRAQTVTVEISRIDPDLATLLTAKGLGKTELRYSGDDEESNRLNRRVEVRLVVKQ